MRSRGTMPLRSLIADVVRPWTASNCCYRGRRSAPKWNVSVFSIKKWYVVVFVFTCLPVRHQSLRLSQPNNFADRQYARIHRAATDLLLVTCRWRHRCRFRARALGCSAAVAFGCVLLVARFWLPEVGRGVRCSGSGNTLWPVRTLGRKQVVSSRLSDTSGRN